MSRGTPAVPLHFVFRRSLLPLHHPTTPREGNSAKDGLILPKGSPLPRFRIRLAEVRLTSKKADEVPSHRDQGLARLKAHARRRCECQLAAGGDLPRFKFCFELPLVRKRRKRRMR
jgi:hypothetical protein